MKSIRNVLAGTLLAGGALLAAATGCSVARAADESAAPEAPAHWMARHGHRHGWGAQHLYEKLSLSTQQRASMKAIMTAARPQMTGMHRQMRANHLRLMQIKPDDPNYGNVVADVAQLNATLAAQSTTQRSELRAKMYAVLTQAQKTQLAGLEAKWASKAAPEAPAL